MGQTPPKDDSAAVIERISDLLAITGDCERAPWLFARCWLFLDRFVHYGSDPADLDRALADFDALPGDFPGRPKLAVLLMGQILREDVPKEESERFDRAEMLAEIGNTDPHPIPNWDQAYAGFRIVLLTRAGTLFTPGFRYREALAEIERYAETYGESAKIGPAIQQARLVLNRALSLQDQDLATAARVAREAEILHGQLDPQAPGRTGAKYLAVMSSLQEAILRGDYAGAVRRFRIILEEARSLPPGDPVRMGVEQMATFMGPMLEYADGPQGRTGVGGDPLVALTKAQLQSLKQDAERPGYSDAERAPRLAALATFEMGVATTESLDSAVEHIELALTITAGDALRRKYAATSAGMIYIRRMEHTGNRADLTTATAYLEQAVALAGSSTDPSWTTASRYLAYAYRISGRAALARQTALGGLRGHAWNALIQAGAVDVHQVVEDAAGEALSTARWCLTDNDPEAAATALDMGRGLILHAAVETRDADARLLERGERRLAQQWRQAVATTVPSDLPADLRRRVMSALAGVPLGADGSLLESPGDSAARLLNPPDAHEIRAALVALDMDALIYLVPGDDKDWNGSAVVIPAADEPDWMLLPQLNAQRLGEFETYLVDCARGAAGAGAGPAEGGALRDMDAKSAGVVDGVCDWAWEAAIGPLLEERLDLPEGRPIRLVLIPMRELTRVPWHAARYREDGRTHYALERAVFSYAASARMFCESAWRSEVPLTESGLIVGDPDTAGQGSDLPSARVEAQAVRDCFYPDARYVGRRPAGGADEHAAGDRAEVLRWLTDPEGGPMAHLACHAVVRSGVGSGETSYLLLAGGQHLAAEELISALSEGSGREIALAVLAACGSAESGRGYDEAFSLATAFLANNTRSVVSAQWSVPDAETSVLMFMFHHNLRVKGLAPVDALREAQLWMIGDRRPPVTMPPILRDQLSGQPDPEVAAWAAFVHYGR